MPQRRSELTERDKINLPGGSGDAYYSGFLSVVVI
jgi:hypothetical protein